MQPTQLANIFPNVDQNSAVLGYGGGQMIGQQYQQALQNNDINQRGALQQLSKNSQMNPLEIQGKQLSNQSQEIANRTNLFTQEQKERLKDPQYAADLAELSAKVPKAQLEGAMATLKNDMMSPDPKVREEAKHKYLMTSDIAHLQEQARLQKETELARQYAANAGSLAVAKENNAGRLAIEESAQRAGKYAKNSYWAQTLKGLQGNLEQQTGAWTQIAFQLKMEAGNSQDPNERASLEAQAEQASQMAELARRSNYDAKAASAYTSAAKSVDLNALQSGQLKAVTVPVPPTSLGGSGPTATTPAQPVQGYSQEDLEFTAKKYNMTVDQVKQKLGIK